MGEMVYAQHAPLPIDDAKRRIEHKLKQPWGLKRIEACVDKFMCRAFYSTEKILVKIDESAERRPAFDVAIILGATAHVSWLMVGLVRDWIIAPPLIIGP